MRQLLSISAAGSEFQVNTFTTGAQEFPKVAMDSSGDFVATWASFGQDGGGYGVYAQRYNSAGVAQGGEFQVNTFDRRSKDPRVAMNQAAFVITWTSGNQVGGSDNIYAQRYKLIRRRTRRRILVNTTTTNNASAPEVAMDSAGDFVVTRNAVANTILGNNIYGVYAWHKAAGAQTRRPIPS